MELCYLSTDGINYFNLTVCEVSVGVYNGSVAHFCALLKKVAK
jgi:hypothetical protein